MANEALAQLGESDIAITSGPAGSESNPIVLQTVNPFTGSNDAGVSGAVLNTLGAAVGDVPAVGGALATGLEGVGSAVGKTLGNLLGPIWWVVALAGLVLVIVLWVAK